jgi:hypothetical protein
MNDTLQRYALAIAAHIALVFAWYLFVKLGNVPKFVMPSPEATLNALLQPNYNWWGNIAVTGTEIFAGYFLALVVGHRARDALHVVEGARIVLHAAARVAQHDSEGRARAADHRLVQVRRLSEHADGVLDLRLPDPADDGARLARDRA